MQGGRMSKLTNPICDIQIYAESNHKYANTVNLVLFQAKRPYKNVQKYRTGLKKWSDYHKKYFPHHQIQLFVDSIVLENEEVKEAIDILANRNQARVLQFSCPPYQFKDEEFHRGLFGTMIRFFTMFDINPHPLQSALSYDIEPDEEDLGQSMELFELAQPLLKTHNVAIVAHTLSILHPKSWAHRDALRFKTFEGVDVPFPHLIAGRFMCNQKIPFSLWTEYLKRIDSGERFYNFYSTSDAECKEKGDYPYCFGIDEIFQNQILLPWLDKKGYGIGIAFHFSLSHVLYHWSRHLERDSRSAPILDYIMHNVTSGSVRPFKTLAKEFDTLFFAPKQMTDEMAACATRFFTVLQTFPGWLPRGVTAMLLSMFPGVIYSKCVFIIRDGMIVKQVEVEPVFPRVVLTDRKVFLKFPTKPKYTLKNKRR